MTDMTDKELTQAFRDARAVLDDKKRTVYPGDSREKLEEASGAKIEIEKVERYGDELIVTLACLVEKEMNGLIASKPLFCQGRLQVRLQFPQGDNTAETYQNAWYETQVAFSVCLRALVYLQDGVLRS